MDSTLRALNRFGLGARPGERQAIGGAARDWLLAQLDGGAPQLRADDVPAPQAIAEALRGLRMLAGANPERRREARRALLELAAAEAGTALRARVTSDRPYVERLVAFWSNHLCVSAAGKLLVAPLAGAYEREAIRPHVLGRFEHLVLASARHPAMLAYLDNFQSIGPSSTGARFARRNGAARGLNENYARELLELHTLGVDGGYTQQDVQELARMLTGWTIAGLGARTPAAAVEQRARGSERSRRNERSRRTGERARRARASDNGPVRFAFVPLLHEPGSKTLLGTRYAEAGVEEGTRAIRALVRHPSTARFVATKLVRHFVADDPPAGAVDRIAATFAMTDGDLQAVARALVHLEDAWDARYTKFRAPQDWIVAMLRAFGASSVHEATMPLLRQLRQPLWSPPSPKGYGDTTEEWADPDSLMNRAELARTIARRVAATNADPAALLEMMDVASNDPVRVLVRDRSVARDERIALALAGPAFQWR